MRASASCSGSGVPATLTISIWPRPIRSFARRTSFRQMSGSVEGSQRHREGGADAGSDPPRDDGGLLLILHAADVREAPGRAIRRADGGVGQDVVAEARVEIGRAHV